MNLELIKSLNNIPVNKVYSGVHPEKWYSKVGNNDNFNIEGLSILSKDARFDRNALKIYLKQNVNDKSTLIAIMAWGNRNMKNARLMFDNGQNEDCILELVNLIRNGAFNTRREAFDYFISEKKDKKKYKGLGIAFFTKILWFARPDLKGYILDQFVAKSINLIFNNNKISLSSKGYVQINNNCITYEQYCLDVEEISKINNEDPEVTEEKLFSSRN